MLNFYTHWGQFLDASILLHLSMLCRHILFFLYYVLSSKASPTSLLSFGNCFWLSLYIYSSRKKLLKLSCQVPIYHYGNSSYGNYLEWGYSALIMDMYVLIQQIIIYQVPGSKQSNEQNWQKPPSPWSLHSLRDQSWEKLHTI